MGLKTYKVVDGPLSVRLEPGGQWLAQIPEGYQFVADSDSKVESNGYVWLQHDAGWSAMRTSDKSKVYIEKVKEEAEPENADPEVATITFKTNRQVRVRKAPTLSATHLRWLEEGETFQTSSDTRTEADGYIWWQHSEGWSASESLDGRWVFMAQVETAPPVESSAQSSSGTESATTEKPATPATTSNASSTATTTNTANTANTSAVPIVTSRTITLQALTDVRIRSEPDLSAVFIKWLPKGTEVVCNASSETTNDGYVWLHHADGWSAVKNTSGSTVFLGEPGTIPKAATMTDNGPDVTTLPDLKTLIQRLPVDLNQTAWWQYFGNNVYAFKHGKEWGYDRYAQGLHSGLDFGNNNAGIPVFAGMNCTFVREDRYGVHFKSGYYNIIYQHLTNTASFTSGQEITPDTKIGELDPSPRLRHLHFEIRYQGAWIVNPLLFMSDDALNQITGKFKPDNPIYFYKSGAWNQWLTPLDQPVIKLGGDVIGPLGQS